MPLIGSRYSTGDGLSLGVSLVLLEIPNDVWVKENLIAALNTLTIEANFQTINSSNTPETAAGVWSLILQTLLFDYEPPMDTPVGTIIMWSTAVAPANWLLCQGQNLLRADYPDLFSVIGVTYGSADGTHFNIPDMRDCSPMGVGTWIPLLGAKIGEFEHTLSVPEIPAHTHPPLSPATVFWASHGGGSTNVSGAVAGTRDNIITTGSTGGSLPHNNVHPVIGLNYAIKAIPG